MENITKNQNALNDIINLCHSIDKTQLPYQMYNAFLQFIKNVQFIIDNDIETITLIQYIDYLKKQIVEYRKLYDDIESPEIRKLLRIYEILQHYTI